MERAIGKKVVSMFSLLSTLYKGSDFNVKFVQNHFQQAGHWQFIWEIYMHKIGPLKLIFVNSDIYAAAE